MASTRGFATQKGATARPLESKTKTKSAPIRSQRNSLRQAIKKSLLDVPTTTTTTVATSLAPLHRSSGRVRKSRANRKSAVVKVIQPHSPVRQSFASLSSFASGPGLALLHPLY